MIDLDPIKRVLYQVRVHVLKDKVMTPRHATLIHEEAEHAVDRIHQLVFVLVVLVVQVRCLVAQIAFDGSILPRYLPVLCIFDGFLP